MAKDYAKDMIARFINPIAILTYDIIASNLIRMETVFRRRQY